MEKIGTCTADPFANGEGADIVRIRSPSPKGAGGWCINLAAIWRAVRRDVNQKRYRPTARERSTYCPPIVRTTLSVGLFSDIVGNLFSLRTASSYCGSVVSVSFGTMCTTLKPFFCR